MILFASQSLCSFIDPICASKSLSQLGGSHGSLPTTAYCRAGRTNLLLSEFWGIKPCFLALLFRGPYVRQSEQELLWLELWWGALTSPTKMSPGLESWRDWGVQQVAPPPRPNMELQGSYKHTHCYSSRSLLWCWKSGAVSLLQALTSSCTFPSELWPQV